MKKVLFICHGNINRSAAAELISKSVYADKFKCRSAGVADEAGGRLTSKKMRASLTKAEFSLTETRSTKATKDLIDRSDLVFYMDKSNLKRLEDQFGPSKKYHCLAAMIGNPKIKDPGFSSNILDFEQVVFEVSSCIKAFVKSGCVPLPAVPEVVKAKAEKKVKKVKPLAEGYMPIKKFGKLLIETNDLDPIYIMLHDSGMSLSMKKRWLLAYSCYYNAGVASKCAEKRSTFYEMLRKGHDEKWPRGSERRHFRGGTSDYVTSWLAKTYPRPEDAVDYLIGNDPKGTTFEDVNARLKSWKYFGPWIAFKWADLIDRVLGVPVDFSTCHLDLYESPRKGAELVSELSGKNLGIKEVVAKLEDYFSNYNAAPDFKRPVNVQEVETVLCKWKSHTSGHYHIGKDIVEIKEALHGWGTLAESLIEYLPPIPEKFKNKSDSYTVTTKRTLL